MQGLTPNQQIPAPTLGGVAIFGDLPSFEWSVLAGPGQNETAPEVIDAFLGFTPGTTLYGPGAGRLIGITGALIAPTSGGVSTLLATLQGAAGPPSGLALGVPTGNPWPDNWKVYSNAYIYAPEIVPSSSGIVQITGGNYSLSYAMVVRQIDANAQPSVGSEIAGPQCQNQNLGPV
jgi:hypothetical protein